MRLVDEISTMKDQLTNRRGFFGASLAGVATARLIFQPAPGLGVEIDEDVLQRYLVRDDRF